MSHLSTPRYDVLPAPGRLCLVQELLNTASAGRPRMQDLLASRDHAQPWLNAALDEWSAGTGQVGPDVTLTDHDLVRLRQLRSSLHQLRSHDPDQTAPAPEIEIRGTVDLILTADGMSAVPNGKSGAARAQAVILAECFQAQIEGTWSRLKVCKNPKCDVAFYDRSKNASAVWHDVRICGNAINLRASRARNRKD